MLRHYFGRAAPYAVVLAGAVSLYAIASGFEFTPVPGRIGPDLWPKMILILLGAVCVFELVRITVMALLPARDDLRSRASQTQMGPVDDEDGGEIGDFPPMTP